MPRSSSRLAAVLAGIALTWALPAAAAPRRFAIDREASEVGYRVQTKVFLLLDEAVAGQARPSGGALILDGGSASGWLELPSADFRSGVASRDRNVAAILEASSHPTIRFDLDAAESLDPGVPGGRCTVSGRLRVRDRAVRLLFPATWRRAGDRVELAGEVQVAFSTFGLQAPVLGLIAKRAPDALLLHARIVGREVDTAAIR